MRKRCRKFSCLHMSLTLRSKNSSTNRRGVETNELSWDMNVDSVCNIMEEKQLHRNQPKEPNETEVRDCATICSTCSSNVIVPVVLPTISYQPPIYNYKSSDWEIYEEIRFRELEEAKARAAQMEKTMRWWSDCTANWREKWSKVRAEKNKAREESRQLKLKLEESVKELSALKKINQGLLRENEEMRAQHSWKNKFDPSEMSWIKEECLGPLEKDPGQYMQNMFELESACQNGYPTENLEILDSGRKYTPVFLENLNPSKGNPNHSQNDEPIHISVLHLYESKKILQKEQKIRSSLEKEIEKVKSEKSLCKRKSEELQKYKHGNLKQLGVHNDLCQTEVERSVEYLEEDTEARSPKDMKIFQLQAEIDRLWSECATSGRRRKILETEKQELDRENRRLKAKVKN
uniref:Coiled-coil domain-containing protein 102B n=1 Tax=Pogona vitticeps TaxID=103695 RepID=A0ABM5GB35_9SAUR